MSHYPYWMPNEKDYLISIFKQHYSHFETTLCSFQNIHSRTKHSYDREEPKLIAYGIGYQYYFSPTIEYSWGSYGISMMYKQTDKFNVIHRSSQNYSVIGSENRLFQTSIFDDTTIANVPIRVIYINTELEYDENEIKYKQLHELYNKTKELIRNQCQP